MAQALKDYAKPSPKRSAFELAVTTIPFFALWAVMALGLSYGYWIALALALPAGALLVRLFLIQHDCGHYSFFASRRANDVWGWMIGVLTLTPYSYWRDAHAIHHATAGNLDKRGIGDIHILTVREFEALSRFQRFAYRLYRNPAVFFGLGPTYLFIIKFRLPLDLLRKRWRLLPGILVTNLLIVAIIAIVGFMIGYAKFAIIQVPITMIAASIGVWLFFIQHQFETTYWGRDGNWEFHEASLSGSSFYDLPRVLHWLTANIGIHHVHHLCSRIPCYRLHDCLDHIPELRKMNRITIRESFKCIPLTLWDEEHDRLISFRSWARKRKLAPALIAS